MSLRTPRTLRSLAVAPALVLALTACGGSGSDTATSPAGAASASASASASQEDHNDADVTFAKDMIPHHRQALEMTDLAVEESTGASPEVVDLAVRISSAQGPEIREMSGWLTAWGEEVPGAMGGMDHSGMDMGGMQGMASPDELDTLAGATGAEFDQQFLTLMIAHHEGAVSQSQDELADGTYGPALELAQEIIDAQEAEIGEMTALLEG